MWLEWIGSLLNLVRRKKDEAGIPISGGRLLIIGVNCLSQHGDNNFDVVTLDSSLDFFLIATGRDVSRF